MKRPPISKVQSKHRRAEKDAKRLDKRKVAAGYRVVDGIELPPGAVLANWALLQHNAATIPEIAYPRFYADRPFACRDCGSDELWTATQQKWWYETAKGPIDSIAVRCRSCRRNEKARVAAAREAQSAGLARKAQKNARMRQ